MKRFLAFVCALAWSFFAIDVHAFTAMGMAGMASSPNWAICWQPSAAGTACGSIELVAGASDCTPSTGTFQIWEVPLPLAVYGATYTIVVNGYQTGNVSGNACVAEATTTTGKVTSVATGYMPMTSGAWSVSLGSITIPSRGTALVACNFGELGDILYSVQYN